MSCYISQGHRSMMQRLEGSTPLQISSPRLAPHGSWSCLPCQFETIKFTKTWVRLPANQKERATHTCMHSCTNDTCRHCCQEQSWWIQVACCTSQDASLDNPINKRVRHLPTARWVFRMLIWLGGQHFPSRVSAMRFARIHGFSGAEGSVLSAFCLASHFPSKIDELNLVLTFFVSRVFLTGNKERVHVRDPR
jgi:hypothetical protein